MSFLDPPSVIRCARVSRSWNRMCIDEALWHQMTIRLDYHQPKRVAEEASSGIRAIASVLQNYDASAEQAASQNLLQATIQRYRSRNTTEYFDDCGTWRSLCCRLWRLDCAWSAKDPSGLAPWSTKLLGPDSPQSATAETASDVTETLPYLLPHFRVLEDDRVASGVWRCKIDPEERTYIVSHQKGGIRVFDHSSSTLLWHTASTETGTYRHLEFSRGWLIFDGQENSFEVWRRESLVPDLGRTPNRGHYQRFAFLNSERLFKAFRFQFPYLCAASRDGFVLIWNVPLQEVVETIDVRSSAHDAGNVVYVDFDNRFVFLSGSGAKSVSVFSRRTKRLVWSLGQHFASGKQPPTTWSLVKTDTTAYPHTAFVEQQLVRASPNLWQNGPNNIDFAQLVMSPYQQWVAIHPDLKTKTLLILGQGTILLLRDYQRFFDDQRKPPESFVEIEFYNLQDYFRRNRPRSIEGDYLHVGWNHASVWDTLGLPMLAVHEGRAVVVDRRAWILSLDAAESSSTQSNKALSQAEMPREADNLAEARPDARSREEQAPPISVYCREDRRVSASHWEESYAQCSSVQMDEVGVYMTADRYRPGAYARGGSWDATDRGRRVLVQLDFSKPPQPSERSIYSNE